MSTRTTVLTRALMGCYSLSMFALPIASFAQDAQEPSSSTTTTSTSTSKGQIQEVIVTAQKRKENLRDAPVSAAVVTEESLVKGGVQTLDDIGKLVPSVVAAPSGGNLRSGFTMRGISTSVITIGAPSGTAVMIDGVTLAPESMAAKQLTDVQNVEVLRGPQATLGGRTASSGVINIVTRVPEAEFGGRAGATLTNDGQRRVEGFVTGPIAQQLKFSLSGYDGKTLYPTRNLNTGEHDREKAKGIRAKLLYTPTRDLDVTFMALHSDMENKGTFQSFIVLDPKAVYRGIVPYRTAIPEGITVSRENVDYAVRGTPGTTATDKMYSLVANYRIGGWTLSSVTARQEEDRDFVANTHLQNSDWASMAFNGRYSWDNSQRSVLAVRTTSQEFKVVSPQMGILDLLAGVYYGHDETKFDFARATVEIPFAFSAFRMADTKTKAAYARATWTLTPDLNLITGLRVNRDEIGYVYNLRYNTPPSGAPSVPFSRSDAAAQNTTVGDVALRYKLSPTVSTYASFARGYKPAIWNLDGTITPANDFRPVDRENVNSYELGLKGAFLNRRLTLNAALFNTVYTNFQVQTFDPVAPASSFALANAGKASTRGIELDGRALLPAEFRMNASLAFIDAKYDDYGAATCYTAQTVAQGCARAASGTSYQNLSGTRLPNAPKWKFNVGLERSIPIDSMPFDLTVGGTYAFQTQVNFDPNGNPIAVQGAYGILNLNATLAERNGRYDVSLFANNALNRGYISGIIDQGVRWGNVAALTAWRSRDAQRYVGVRLNAYF
ncbi:TonB-dependent receptor [Telluria mixta]|uniref:TonB-dependent receptor n=1 Tax=Telluria mixta TaxID=34071 RepID=A0ABT2BRZ6_9BURK|nr:TonB-dependent receptor [Telluria mixta]MCS0627893.1 TonB-dependent receptor [Telluria mixta]WEM93988.1 TonB-dependent receptor [Telluria mixta]